MFMYIGYYWQNSVRYPGFYVDLSWLKRSSEIERVDL